MMQAAVCRKKAACLHGLLRMLMVGAAVALTAAPAPPPKRDPALASAVALFEAKKYPEAREAFEKLVEANPRNAAAHHYLGRTLIVRNDDAAMQDGLKALARAVELEPENPVYLGIYGGTSLQFAGRTNSLLAATRGREAMEKAIALDPDYLAAREGLFQYYSRAPWPLGSRAKATAQLEEIRKRNPDLATALDAMTKTNKGEYAAAFRLCEDVLAIKPANYIALYHYGRTAAISGEQLALGLARLEKCLTLDPPTPASPSHSNVWQRIGNLHEKRQQPAEARTAYEKALELDPGNIQAQRALAQLK